MASPPRRSPATAAYDGAIARWFGTVDQGETFPPLLPLTLKRAASLRYGENPHQSAAFYTASDGVRGIGQARQVQGKELSYNNLNDADAALELVAEFRDAAPTCVIVKHANPCGVATADSLEQAYAEAFACDTVSAFGGIIAVNRPLDGATARAIAGIFTEWWSRPMPTRRRSPPSPPRRTLRLLLTGECPIPTAPACSPRRSPAAGWCRIATRACRAISRS